MIWITVLAVLAFLYSIYTVLMGEPAASPYEDERAKLPAHQYAYASKLSANYTRRTWRIWAGLELVLAAFLLGRIGKLEGFWAWLVLLATCACLIRIAWVEITKPYKADIGV